METVQSSGHCKGGRVDKRQKCAQSCFQTSINPSIRVRVCQNETRGCFFFLQGRAGDAEVVCRHVKHRMGLERRAPNMERGLAEHWCEESWQQVAGLGKISYKKEGGEVFFSASDEQMREPSKEGRHCVKACQKFGTWALRKLCVFAREKQVGGRVRGHTCHG